MDVIGGVIARLDRYSPLWSDRLRWRRAAREDLALRVVDALVSRGDVVVDIGASRGLFSSRMRDLVGPRGAVHAFEPNPEHHERLRSLAAHGRVRLHPVALSDHEGQATLHVPLIDGRAYTGWASLEEHPHEAAQTVAVPTHRLDDVLGSEGRGLRPRVASACDAIVSIPIRSRIDSLSVSAAAAVLLYAAVRTRSAGPNP